jgi:precorrin-2 dehydrogenase / sirohydrochlorin ferrochelatase
MARYYAAFLDLRGRLCLVVGGGSIAERKVTGLLEAGARVRVVSPTLTIDLEKLACARTIEHRGRRFRRVDTRGCTLVVAATGVAEIDDAVAAAARGARALVNVVDRPASCDFILPSVLRRGELQIAVSTGGRSPALAREIRRRLESEIGEDYAALVTRVGDARARLRRRRLTPAARMQAADHLAMTSLAQHVARV